MDRLVTIFGGGGFLGRYVVQELLRRGARVRVAERDPRKAWFLKPLGGLGQTQFAAVDIRRAGSVAKVVAGSDAVANLVGLLAGDFEGAHVEGASNVAKAAAAAGVGSLTHVSAIGADAESPSAYGRTKSAGEAAVRAAFPGATIVRPSVLFGPEDDFVNRFARMAQAMPVLPVIRPGTCFQPAFVADVARAIATALLEPRVYAGRTFELGGPQTISMEKLNHWIAETIEAERTIVPVPDVVAKALAWLPGPPISWDQWLMLQRDNVVSDGAEGFAAFGIQPTPLAAVAPDWLVRYRRHGRFTKPRAA